MIDILPTQPSILKWRLLSPSLRQVVAAGCHVVAIGSVRHPHLLSLLYEGLGERQLAWILAEAPSERMGVTEQVIQQRNRRQHRLATQGAAGAVAAPSGGCADVRRCSLPLQAYGGSA